MKIKKKLTHKELLSWVRLARTANIGPVTFAAFIKIYKTPERALEVLPELIKNSGSKKYKLCSVSDAEMELEQLEKIGARIITAGEEDYPSILRTINDYPPILTVWGNAELLKKDMIAIVGGRSASINGRNISRQLACDLAKEGFVVVSGLARGIDTAAHSIILKSLPTIAVIGSGINIVYPRENTELYNNLIEKGGLVVSELAFNTLPKAQFFPQRNRIIAGLSLGVIVIEASRNSGSLITANFALNQNREVFAVPGSPLDSRCSGNNSLIKNGAKLIESAEDVIESIRFNHNNFLSDVSDNDYNHKVDDNFSPSLEEIKMAKNLIISCLDSVPIEIDEIVASTTLKPNVVLIALLELELAEIVERHANNRVSLAYSGLINSGFK